MNTVTLTAATAALMLFGSSLAQAMGKPNPEPEYTPAPATSSIKVKGFDEATLAPDTRFNGFQTFYVEPPEITFDKHWRRDVRGDMSSNDERRIKSQYANALTEAVKKALSRETPLRETTAVNATTLIIQPNLGRFRINGPDLSVAGRTKHFVDYVGSAEILFTLKSGSNQVVLATLADHRQTRSFNGIMELKQTNRAENLRDFKRLYGRWADKLARFLNSVE